MVLPCNSILLISNQKCLPLNHTFVGNLPNVSWIVFPPDCLLETHWLCHKERVVNFSTTGPYMIYFWNLFLLQSYKLCFISGFSEHFQWRNNSVSLVGNILFFPCLLREISMEHWLSLQLRWWMSDLHKGRVDDLEICGLCPN